MKEHSYAEEEWLIICDPEPSHNTEVHNALPESIYVHKYSTGGLTGVIQVLDVGKLF